MRNLPFPYVTIKFDSSGTQRKICSLAEAAELLELHWPRRDGEKLSLARQACQNALEGKVTCTAALEAFIEAAKEAGIYVGRHQIK